LQISNFQDQIFVFQYVHGCPSGECPSLPRYVGRASEEEVLEATRKRDEFFLFWIKNNNSNEKRLPARYFVVNDCHHADFGLNKLLEFHELAELRRPYETLPKRTLSFPDDILAADQELTYLLIGRGEIPEDQRQSGMPLFVWIDEPGNRRRQDFGWSLENRDYLFTRDTLEHLVWKRGFKFSSISACYFYKKCKVLPLVFGGFVAEREASSQAGNESLANFLKATVNFTTGMFGLKGKSKAVSKIRLTSSLSHGVVNCLESIDFKLAGTVAGQKFYVCKRLAPLKKPVKRAGIKKQPSKATQISPAIFKRRKATDAALPIYASVVEFGKMRLLNCLEFLQNCLRPGAVRILYSQVDNLVLGLSGEKLENLIDADKKQEFENKKNEYFGNAPGKLVEKWKVSAERDEEFQFASARICTYGLVVRDAQGNWLPGQNKMSGLSNISSQDAYVSNRRLIAGLPGLVFQQERRTNSLLNQNMEPKLIRQLPLPVPND
jgi:hypothetical protein